MNTESPAGETDTPDEEAAILRELVSPHLCS